MRVLNVKQARAIWLLESRDLNPRGIDLWPVLAAVATRYSFQSYPRTVEDANEFDPKGIVFSNGSFTVGNSRHAVVRATIYSDGIVVDSGLSTDFCEEFLADLLGFVSTRFGLTYTTDMVHSRLFVSELIVHTEIDLTGLFFPLAAVSEKLRTITGQKFEPTGFGLSVDSGESAARPGAFRFEREVNKPFSQGRYYSLAPIPTSKHEEVLRVLELQVQR